MDGNKRTVLISGTSRGIGRYLAEHYTGAGYRVVGCSRSDTDWRAADYRHYRVDVTDEGAVKRMFTDVRKTIGAVDVLINNAGLATMNHALLTPISTARNIFDTNVIGTFLLCREAARLMRNSGSGRIVNLTSIATPLNLEGESIYAASKAAVNSLTKTLARELAELGVTVNAIGPAPIETEMTRGVPEEIIDRLLQRQAIHRRGTFQDIVNVIDFFIRRESDFVTGQVIYLGGI